MHCALLSFLRRWTCTAWCCTGFEAADWLAQHHGIATELATSSLVLATFGAGSMASHAERFASALRGLCDAHPGGSSDGSGSGSNSYSDSRDQRVWPDVAAAWAPGSLPVMQLTPREAHFAPSERCTRDLSARLSELDNNPYSVWSR